MRRWEKKEGDVDEGKEKEGNIWIKTQIRRRFFRPSSLSFVLLEVLSLSRFLYGFLTSNPPSSPLSAPPYFPSCFSCSNFCSFTSFSPLTLYRKNYKDYKNPFIIVIHIVLHNINSCTCYAWFHASLLCHPWHPPSSQSHFFLIIFASVSHRCSERKKCFGRVNMRGKSYKAIMTISMQICWRFNSTGKCDHIKETREWWKYAFVFNACNCIRTYPDGASPGAAG